jgi:hypothetical protein
MPSLACYLHATWYSHCENIMIEKHTMLMIEKHTCRWTLSVSLHDVCEVHTVSTTMHDSSHWRFTESCVCSVPAVVQAPSCSCQGFWWPWCPLGCGIHQKQIYCITPYSRKALKVCASFCSHSYMPASCLPCLITSHGSWLVTAMAAQPLTPAVTVSDSVLHCHGVALLHEQLLSLTRVCVFT